MKAELHDQTIPWKNLMISGWCLAADKTKMSKSKGNVVTPVNLILEKGADVVRYWASTSRLGADTAYSEDVFKIGKKLITKLWNAAKFASIHLQKLNTAPVSAKQLIQEEKIFCAIDLWIISKLKITIEKATNEFQKFEYCNARVAIEEFFWKDFCDNYLEIIKVRAYNESGHDSNGALSAAYSIYHCLEVILKLFAPFIPHITEELNTLIFGASTSIHTKNTWPSSVNYSESNQAKQAGDLCVEILEVIRKVKAEKNISLKADINKLYIYTVNRDFEAELTSIMADLKNVSNAKEIIIEDTLSNDKQYITTENQLLKIAMDI